MERDDADIGGTLFHKRSNYRPGQNRPARRSKKGAIVDDVCRAGGSLALIN